MKNFRGTFIVGLLSLVVFCGFVSTGEAQAKSILINCGSKSSVTVEGRKWVGDLSLDDNITLSSAGIAVSTRVLSSDSVFEPLYRTARVFENGMNFTFRGIVEGNYFVTLHFCPFPFDNYNVNESSFDVGTNHLKLVSEYNVLAAISKRNQFLQSAGSNSSSFFLVKEYFVDVKSDGLAIEFKPSKGSFGFINAIEVVLVVAELYPNLINKVSGAKTLLNLSGSGTETMYRLNVGGPEIRPNDDLELSRTWEVDSHYMFAASAGDKVHNKSNVTYASIDNKSVAPLLVYETARTMSNAKVLERRFNMSWNFIVDPDFDYLIRLHFCELEFDKASERIFKIYINNRTAADNVDIYKLAGGSNIAHHMDYVDSVSPHINTLWIQLGPDSTNRALETDALLNGVEIFKLSRNGNLAHMERFNLNNGSDRNSKTKMIVVGIVVGIGSVLIGGVIAVLIYCLWKKRRKESVNSDDSPPSLRPLVLHGSFINSKANANGAAGTQNPLGSLASVRVGKQFTFTEIRGATNNFDETLVIGIGGFGKVFKGEMEDGSLVAIKRANPHSQQGLVEFETEIQMLSKLRHRHLVSLIGFCDEKNEMILVYEYMANGTLRNHLFGGDLPPLSWKQRLEVCIGAARGLHYLHTGAERGVIHRDVKTTNILLDENFVAKMSDFGLSKTGPALDHTHVSTAVKGSFGYLDPEYFRRQQLTEKSDVYSFGVVLFEVVCARAVINPTLPRDQINLVEWAMRWQRQGSFETIIDPQLRRNYSPESLKKFGEIAEKCLADDGKNRPTMGEVSWHLEFVLQLQESSMCAKDEENSSSSIHVLTEKESDEGRKSLSSAYETDSEHSIAVKEDTGTSGIIASSSGSTIELSQVQHGKY